MLAGWHSSMFKIPLTFAIFILLFLLKNLLIFLIEGNTNYIIELRFYEFLFIFKKLKSEHL